MKIWVNAQLPPAIATNARLKEILAQSLQPAIKLLESGEAIVEISGA